MINYNSVDLEHGGNMSRAYYYDQITDFIDKSNDEILGKLSNENQFDLTLLQKSAWKFQIELLKEVLYDYNQGHIVFEYTIPRIGSRIDVVIILYGCVILLEFKVGETNYSSTGIEQVENYALDLKNFHSESENVYLFPILVATEATEKPNEFSIMKDKIYSPILCNKVSLKAEIHKIFCLVKCVNIVDFDKWFNAVYKPTPTIIEAAQALYSGHNVSDISRNDASAKNISITTKYVMDVIDYSKTNKKKSICFVTGVPGAGKTLVGLNIANEFHKFETGSEEHAIYLSGNEPLVTVLKEALTRDSQRLFKEQCIKCKEENIINSSACKQCDKNINKSDFKRKTKSFIQMIHHFRNASLNSSMPPIEKIVIFDEAQRAWKRNKLKQFMKERSFHNFDMSEPEFLISYLDRHKDWATIICLVGGGQEIHDGEAGISEWFHALNYRFSDWSVRLSSSINEYEYVNDSSTDELLHNIKEIFYSNDLHLATSLRSFRSERISEFTKALIDADVDKARSVYNSISGKYPIKITRDLDVAKKWVKNQAHGSERYGIVASSGAKRLRSEGIMVPKDMEVEKWFLNGKTDVNSSYYLEVAASEFKIQGLEIDYAIVAWEADYRFENKDFSYYDFIGTKWNRIKDFSRKSYLKNSYRVLLTRARQGFIIYIPRGDGNDETRNPKYYEGTYEYLKRIGIEEINQESNTNTQEFKCLTGTVFDPSVTRVNKDKKIKSTLPSNRNHINIEDKSLLNLYDEKGNFSMNNVLKLKNKEFAFYCLDQLKNDLSANDERVTKLTNKGYCKDKFDMNYPILQEVNRFGTINNDLFRDSVGNRRYYPETIILNDKRFIVCNDWYYGNKRDTRTEFAKWCLKI